MSVHSQASIISQIQKYVVLEGGKWTVRCYIDIVGKYSRLSLSRSPRDSLNYFEISVARHIRYAALRKTINRTTTFNKWICNLTPEVKRYVEKYCGKEEQFLPFSTIFWYLLLDFHVRTGTIFSLRDKRLFEISEVEITRVDCSFVI